MISKGYRPEARGWTTQEGNKSHNPELKADKWLIFTLARIVQEMQKYNEKKFLYCSPFFCFSTFHAGTGGINKVLGCLIMLVFQSRISNCSRIPITDITRTLANSNLPLTRTNCRFPSGHFLYHFTLDNSKLFHFPLKVRVIGSRL